MERKLLKPAWKYRELVAALGDDDTVRARIKDEGFEPPPRKTIAGWRLRNSVPGAWAPLLIDLAFREDRIDRMSQLRKA